MAANLKSIGRLTNAELLELFEETGIVSPWNTLQMQAAQYVQRMTELQPGSIQFKAAVNDMISTESRRGLLGMTRRAAQQWTTIQDTGGDKNKQFIWVTEADDRTCAPCMSNAAEIRSYAEWEEIGLPGAATCDGGDYCRCDLLPTGDSGPTGEGAVIQISKDEILEPKRGTAASRKPAEPEKRKEKRTPPRPQGRSEIKLGRQRTATKLNQRQREADVNARMVSAGKAQLDAFSHEERADFLRWNWVHGANRKGSVELKTALKKEFKLSGIVQNRRGFSVSSKAVETFAADARKIYDATQAAFAKAGVKTVKLYRGVQTSYQVAGVVESWTTDINVAKKFGGIIMEKEVPVDKIFTSVDSPGWIDGVWGGQKEYMVMQ